MKYHSTRIAALLICAAFCAAACPATAAAQQANLSIEEFGDSGLSLFLQVAGGGVPVDMLVGIWLYEGGDIRNPDISHLTYLRSVLEERAGQSVGNQLKAYLKSATARAKTQGQMGRMSDIMYVINNKRFPLPEGVAMWYEDTWSAPREYGGERAHEGIDIICAEGTPIYSVCDGVVEKRGWNTLGGWRVGVRGIDGVYYYYAHMRNYASGILINAEVRKGQVLGYVGSTGYGPEGTSDMMIPHLHFGMYLGYGDGAFAVNAYPFLRAWE